MPTTSCNLRTSNRVSDSLGHIPVTPSQHPLHLQLPPAASGTTEESLAGPDDRSSLSILTIYRFAWSTLSVPLLGPWPDIVGPEDKLWSGGSATRDGADLFTTAAG